MPAPARDPESDIRQLTVNYALGTDAIGRHDRDGGVAIYRRTFTADAEIMVAGAPDTKRIGPEAWADYVDGHFRAQDYRETQHLMGTINVTIDASGTKAAMSSYLQAAHVTTDRKRVYMVLGTYIDEVAETPDGWRITKRTLHPTVAWNVYPGT